MGHDARATANVDVEISEKDNIAVFRDHLGEETREHTDTINIGLRGSVH